MAKKAKQYLKDTKYKHNDLGYDELVALLSLDVPIFKIAKKFNVTPPTIYKWMRDLGIKR